MISINRISSIFAKESVCAFLVLVAFLVAFFVESVSTILSVESLLASL
jgi:hypothetical protein